MLRLPLGETQARELIGRCQQAPYGKGTQTLVDTTVRRVWELDPEHFQLSNPKWDQLIESIVGEVQGEKARFGEIRLDENEIVAKYKANKGAIGGEILSVSRYCT